MFLPLAALLIGSPAIAGEISADGSAIEVQDVRCEVKSAYSIQCVNIGRVCVDYRARKDAADKKTFGCALKDSPNYPCPPSTDFEKLTEEVKKYGHCSPMIMGGW